MHLLTLLLATVEVATPWPKKMPCTSRISAVQRSSKATPGAAWLGSGAPIDLGGGAHVAVDLGPEEAPKRLSRLRYPGRGAFGMGVKCGATEVWWTCTNSGCAPSLRDEGPHQGPIGGQYLGPKGWHDAGATPKSAAEIYGSRDPRRWEPLARDLVAELAAVRDAGCDLACAEEVQSLGTGRLLTAPWRIGKSDKNDGVAWQIGDFDLEVGCERDLGCALTLSRTRRGKPIEIVYLANLLRDGESVTWQQSLVYGQGKGHVQIMTERGGARIVMCARRP